MVKLLITNELQKVKKSLSSNICLMVEQLQKEVQQDIRAVQLNLQKQHDDVVKDLQSKRISDRSNELPMKTEHKITVDSQTETELSDPTIVLPLINAVAIKSDHLKLTFPSFGTLSHDSDPLLYLTKYKDFLALSDFEILPTFFEQSYMVPPVIGGM